MLGAVKAVLLAGAVPAVAGSLYTQRIDATSPRKHLRLSEASGIVAANRGSAAGDGTFQNTENITFGLDPLVQNSDGGKSVGLNGATSSTPHVTIANLVTTATFTLDIAFQADRHKAKLVLITQGLSSTTEGAVSLEVQDDGAGGLRLRQWTVIGGTAKIWTTGAGTVPIGSACKISYVQENGVGRRLYVDGVQIGVRTAEASFSAPPTGTWYIGSWSTGSDPVDGCLAEVASWNRALPGAEIGSLAAAQSIIHLGDWSETVTQNESGSIFVSASKTELHPEVGFTTEVVSDGTLVDLTASAGGFDYQTGPAVSLPAPDSAQVRINKDGLQSRTATISFTVDSAPALALPTAPATNAYWVDPIDGNDGISAAQARSATSSPPATSWRSLAKAIAEWNAGNLGASGSGHVEIILRGGLSYERGNALTITGDGTSGSHLIIKGYRDDVAAGVRGGTGKFTGAKGWFVLRGNIQALETGGWESDPGAGGGRLIYRTTSTHSITGNARACWLGATTHNLQLVPVRDRDDLNTSNEVGVTTNPIYSAPGVVQHTDSKIYVRMEANQWTSYFAGYFADSYYPSGTVPTWSTNPNGEPLAIFDDTTGLTLSGVSWIDLSFFRSEYWQRGLRITGNTNNCTADYVHIIASVYCINAGGAGTVDHLDFTHCDLIQNIPPWIGWQWVKENGQGIQARLQGRTIDLTAVYPHHINVKHCRLIRGFDGGGVDNSNADTAPHDIVFENNHLLWMRDDSFAYSSSIYDSRFMYNYHELCWQGYGRTGRPSTGPHTNQAPGTLHIGFNIVDLRRPHLRGRPTDPSGEYNTSGTSALDEDFGLQWGRMDPSHSIDNDEVSENKYYHNLIMCGRDESNVGVWSWKDGIKSTSLQEERYNNIIINAEDAEYHGRGRTSHVEQDYNCYWGDPSGSFSQNKILVNTDGGSQPSYSSWAAFKASGSVYNETKHANGDGPGSPSGWEFHGMEADPAFVNGTWETIVVGDLETYFPAAGGNCGFAVGLTATGWPGTSSPQGHVGAYAPGDAVTKIGPEQGLWHD